MTSRSISPLGYALLGLLARDPLSGYDLAQKLKNNVSYFWHARHSQIYPELAKLESQSLVTFELITQQDRPDKKLYSLSPTGLQALQQWSTTKLPMPNIRDELLLKSYSLWLADPAQAIALFREHEALHAERLATYLEIEPCLKSLWDDDENRLDSPWFGSYATIMRGIGYEREYKEWCAWIAETFEARL